MTMTPAKIVSTLKKSAYGRSSLVYWINRHDTDLATVCRHTLQAVASGARATKAADGVVDTESWEKFLKLGGKYAQKLCAGDVKSDTYSVTISAKAAGKSYTESNARAIRGTLQGKSAVSDGTIAFPCENPPYAYAVIDSMNAVVGNLPNAPVVEIAYVPDFASFDKKQVMSDTDKNLVLLSDETGLNPVLFAAVVAAVGSPYTLRHETTEYKSGKKMSIHREGPVFVSGPNGVGLAMPIRRAIHHLPEKKNPARSPQMEFRFKR